MEVKFGVSYWSQTWDEGAPQPVVSATGVSMRSKHPMLVGSVCVMWLA